MLEMTPPRTPQNEERQHTRGRTLTRRTEDMSPEAVRQRIRERHGTPTRAPRTALRGEGETWASRTEEEGSLIIACCDQTVKFFECVGREEQGTGIVFGK